MVFVADPAGGTLTGFGWSLTAKRVTNSNAAARPTA